MQPQQNKRRAEPATLYKCTWCGKGSQVWVPWDRWLGQVRGLLQLDVSHFCREECLYSHCKTKAPALVLIHEAIEERAGRRLTIVSNTAPPPPALRQTFQTIDNPTAMYEGETFSFLGPPDLAEDADE